MKKNIFMLAAFATFASTAFAQSSVTLYGTIDAGVTYVSNEGRTGTPNDPGFVASNTRHVIGLTSGNVQDSRWGLRGVEDLGGGLKTVFTLESGFDVANGQMASAGTLFDRQASVGIVGDFGTITAGRQYDSVVDYLAPVSAAGTWGGKYFGHPGDNDNLDSRISVSNSLKFRSVNYDGFSFSGVYGFSNAAGKFAANRAYSFGLGYDQAGLKVGAAYLHAQGLSDGNGNGALQGLPASAIANLSGISDQQTWGVGASYAFGPAVLAGVFTQSRFHDDFAGGSLRYSNFEVSGRYNVTPAVGLGAAYTFTQLHAPAVGNDSGSTRFHQFGLQADYAMSKRTSLYAEVVAQLGNGDHAGMGFVQINGTGAPSTSGHQYLTTAGIRHSF